MANSISVLITDDNSAMRGMIKESLGDWTGDVFEAASGEECLAMYRKSQPDCVLMDLMMPGMGGLKATEMLVEEFPKARVIIVTNHNRGVFREAAQRAGALGFVLKENLVQLRGLVESGLSPEGWQQ